MQAENRLSLPKARLWPPNLRDLPHRVHHCLMFALLCLIGFANLRWGERVPSNEGLGYDGLDYGIVTAHLEQLVSGHELNVRFVGRILPCAVVHYGLRALGLSLTIENIVRGFAVLNLTLLLLACGVWMLIANELCLSITERWLGFIALFVNFAVLKQTFYYPVLTDTTAFSLGVLFLYFFLKNSTAGMFLTIFAAAFTWPTFVYPAAILLIVPQRPLANPSGPTGALARVSAAVVAGLFAVVLLYVGVGEDSLFATFQQGPMMQQAVIASTVLCMLYLFFATRTLLNGLTLRQIREIITNCRAARLVAGCGVVALTQFAIQAFAKPETPSATHVRVLVHVYGRLPISRPLIFLLGHVVYFGPVVLLVMLYWGACCEKIRGYGLGMVLFILVQLVIALDPESRHLIGVWPFFVVFLVQVAEDKAWKHHVQVFLVLTSVLLSKVWLPINMAAEPGDPLTFPFQRYFMNHGPWMNTQTYLLQGIAVFLTGLVFFWLTKREAQT